MGKASRRRRQRVVRTAAAAPARLAHLAADVLSCGPHDRALTELRARTREIATVTAERDALVPAARAAGCSWSEIAAALGVTQQAAHKRFASRRPAAPVE